MFHNTTFHFLNSTEKMLKSLNNNTSPFSMENLLSREKLSPENLEVDRSPESERSPLETYRNAKPVFKYCHEPKLSSSPTENTRSESESDRLSPSEKNEVFLRFNSCLKNRICSNCGRLDCNFLQCRMQGENLTLKDNKPVLKFSVSAILGNEHQQESKNVQNGKKECKE